MFNELLAIANVDFLFSRCAKVKYIQCVFSMLNHLLKVVMLLKAGVATRSDFY